MGYEKNWSWEQKFTAHTRFAAQKNESREHWYAILMPNITELFADNKYRWVEQEKHHYLAIAPTNYIDASFYNRTSKKSHYTL